MELGLFLILLVNIGLISAGEWVSPIFTKPEGFPCDKIHVYDDPECANWKFDESNKLKTVYIKFEEEQENPLLIAYIHCTDCDNSGPQIGTFTDGSSSLLGPVLKKEETGKYSLTIKNKLDYETEAHRLFKFKIALDGADEPLNVKIDLLDIDDVAPQIKVHQTPCEIEENYEGETECSFTITDPDTNGLKDVKFIMEPEYAKHFEVKITQNTTNQAEAILVVRKNNTLDFETMPMYFFELTAKDLGTNEGMALIMIKVIDMNDQPPQWIDIFAMKSFEEHKDQEFTVYAKDGDLGINDTILYKWKDGICHDNIQLIENGEKAIIKITGIERDTKEMEDIDNTIKCTLLALEQSSDIFNATAEVSFIIQDINDNKPLITLDKIANSPIKLKEEELISWDKIFEVNDIDQGNNAQFDITLKNPSGTIFNVDYVKPFQVIPNNGYRNWKFAISVVELLDYDRTDDWREFSFEIHSKDKGADPMGDFKSIDIQLLNFNDEIPEFDKSIDYTVNIPEDVKKDAFILSVLAMDADYGDHVKYNLPPEDTDFRLVPIDANASANIYTDRDNVFDYERVKTVYIQVTAKDILKNPEGEPDSFHSVTQQITVNVIDVNDEQPRINLPYETPKIEEHKDLGIVVTNEISAEDVDTKAHLKFSIDWEKCRVSKYGAQSTNITLFKEVFQIETVFPDENKKGYAKGILKVLDSDKLDYEVFDTIFLNVKVTDIEQEINCDRDTDEGTLTILIIDINDHAPEFKMDTITSYKSVTEHSKSDVIISRIIAVDIDGPEYNKVEYELEPINGTKTDLVKIDRLSGDIIVDLNEKIDADCPDYIEYLYYNVTATDGELRTTEPIEIYVEDLNDEMPYLDKKLDNSIKIDERLSKDPPLLIQKVYGDDCDRDKPHNVVKYELNNEITQLSHMFRIDGDTGDVFAHGTIEWKSVAEEVITIHVLLKDNIGGPEGPNTEKVSFDVTITDIDNNPPVLPEPEEIIIPQQVREDSKIGTKITDIIATDKDKPCEAATKIEYTILEVKHNKGKEITKELFKLDKIEGSPPDCKQIAELKVSGSLEGYFGDITIKIHAQNPDTPDNNDVKSYVINVEAVNLKPPIILIPKDSTIILQKEQQPGKKLVAIDEKQIKDFEASDDQDGKFEMHFEPGTPWDNTFELISADGEINKARLTLKVDTPPKTEYTLQLKAYHDGRGTSLNNVTKTITVQFVDKDQLPWFKTLKDNVSFWENVTDEKCQKFPAAIDPKCGDQDINNCASITYYHIMNTLEKKYFKTDITNRAEPELCLIEWLDREVQEYHYLTIVATNDDEPPQRVPDGYDALKLTVEVKDINDNPPSFVQKLFKGGLADTQKIESVIVTLNATDPDTVDIDQLKYEILEDTITVSDSSLNVIKNNAFKLENNEIKNLIQPTQAMQGHFLFSVMVLDSCDYNDTAEVKIHIISDANRVILKFSDDIDTVKSKVKEIEDVLSKEIKYSCTIDDLAKKVNDTATKATSYMTEVKTHFIDNNDEPVAKDDITVKLDDIAIIGRIELRLKDIGLNLVHIVKDNTTDVQDMTELLQILLIVVSVVLGTLCVVLIVAFILRSRSLNNRLEAMTTNVFGSTKSDLNRIGTSAPGTNRHAIEANPVWNEDINAENGLNQYDTMSQASGGSDLIGIEDRPDFEYDIRRASINPVIQQTLQNMSQQKHHNYDDDDDIRSLPGSKQNNSMF